MEKLFWKILVVVDCLQFQGQNHVDYLELGRITSFRNDVHLQKSFLAETHVTLQRGKCRQWLGTLPYTPTGANFLSAEASISVRTSETFVKSCAKVLPALPASRRRLGGAEGQDGRGGNKHILTCHCDFSQESDFHLSMKSACIMLAMHACHRLHAVLGNRFISTYQLLD